MRKLLFVVGLLVLLLNACTGTPVATINPAEVQASAVAAANTMVANTLAAIPTETARPLPTDTPLSTPTVDFTIEFPTSSATPAMGNNDCLHPVDIAEAGPTHRTLIRNEAGATVNLSLNLRKNTFGQCGSLWYAGLGKNTSLILELPAGYWYAYAWATGKGKNFHASGTFFVQPAQFVKNELCVRDSTIVYKPQC